MLLVVVLVLTVLSVFVWASVLTHRVFEPAVFEGRPHLLVNHNLLKLFQGRVLPNILLEWQHVLIHRTCTHTHKPLLNRDLPILP